MAKVKDATSKTKKSKKLKLKKRNDNRELSENDGRLNTVKDETAIVKANLRKKRKGEKGNGVDASNAVHTISQDNPVVPAGEKKQKKSKKKKTSKNEGENNNSINEISQLNVTDENGADKLTGKPKKPRKKGKKGRGSSNNGEEPTTKSIEAHQDDVFVISSGDEDCTKGMKKWITEYHQSRPGLEVLQQRIDDFITAHEAKLEEERKEREAQAAEGGWTVVVHHKGRKKTTDSETGTTVGSVAPAAVEAKLNEKKKDDIGLSFYRFQKREAKRNEILTLQTKFEEDRKRIQERRAQRKFRPY